MLCAAVAIAYAAPRSLPGACLWFTTLGPGDWDDSIEPTTMVGQPAKIERLASKKKKLNSQTWRCNQQGCGLNHPKMWLDQHKNRVSSFHQHEWWLSGANHTNWILDNTKNDGLFPVRDFSVFCPENPESAPPWNKEWEPNFGTCPIGMKTHYAQMS